MRILPEKGVTGADNLLTKLEPLQFMMDFAGFLDRMGRNRYNRHLPT